MKNSPTIKLEDKVPIADPITLNPNIIPITAEIVIPLHL
jgi:hypothetical protein